MAKSIIKELIIFLLLILVIILVLGILLYEYTPMTKTIPSEVSYIIPEEAKAELQSADGVDESEIVMTYEVNSSDLNTFKRTQNYKPGRANPFAAVGTETSGTAGTSGTTGTTANSGNAGTSSSSSEGQSTTNTNTTSGGKFFKDTGTK